jgi:hypothetical protein
MSTSTTKEIDQALLDVRKAYRLLHDYQRAALDAASYIGAQLGFSYSCGYSNFSNCAPRDGKSVIFRNTWAWDWLNLVFYDFCFSKKIGEKDFNFSIWLFSDTGYFVSDNPEADQTDVNSFAPVEHSGTKVGFIMYHTWNKELDQFHSDKEAVRRFLENNGELPQAHKDAGVFAMCCDFSCLSNDESTEEVIAELVKLAKSHDFPLERVKKAI